MTNKEFEKDPPLRKSPAHKKLCVHENAGTVAGIKASATLKKTQTPAFRRR
jgi:hypothetical protein